MANNDRFATIAENNPILNLQVEEVEPMRLPEKFFINTGAMADIIEEKCHAQRLEEFHEELQSLKVYYKPFLEDHTPASGFKRDKFYLDKFDFRYESDEDKRDFEHVLMGYGEWDKVVIPDYRGPTGSWKGFYRTEFEIGLPQPEKNTYICFKGVDYIANVYINGRFVGSHTGFFAPFEFDITEVVKYNSSNILVIEVMNDAPTIGDGDKIYAAAGPGWDEPDIGWHHCPCGAGLYNKVYIEERARLYVNSLFARPDIDESGIEAWVEVYNTAGKPKPDGEGFIPNNDNFELYLSIYPVNFTGEGLERIKCSAKPAGHGTNYYRFNIPLEGFRLWQPQEPWLYLLRAEVAVDGRAVDIYDKRFGMRKVHMEEGDDLSGTLYLNNKPLILRGANEMGHLQQCVMKEDYEQLTDDILIAKIANMNYYRITQRPVQEEIYDYFDMLGMLQQCDLPLFGYVRRNVFSEGIKQAEEMERFVRSHPSTVMITYINENLPVGSGENRSSKTNRGYNDLGHRHLYRDELEAFFTAATQAVRLHNPDRVVKNCEGDYDPPTCEGLSDFHCYNMWYTNHAIPIGKLHKGCIPPIKTGWKAGCGEYGTEGLDPLHIMLEKYPKRWVPENLEDQWFPNKIVMAQSFLMHGDWYEEQYTIQDWIRESQEHQAFAARMMTDALRRRSDRIISTAIHLLIDAWPSGWMKTLVACDRTPKPAFFAFKDSLVPVRVNLRTDKLTHYSGNKASIEAWVLNDTPQDLAGCRIVATVVFENKVLESFEAFVDARAVYPTFAGRIVFTVPQCMDRERITVHATLYKSDMNAVNSEKITMDIFEKEEQSNSINVMTAGKKAKDLMEKTGISCCKNLVKPDVYVVSSGDLFKKDESNIISWVENGTKVLVLLEEENTFEWSKEQIEIKFVNNSQSLTFLARNSKHPATGEFLPKDFSFWYNCDTDCIDFISNKQMEGKSIIPLLFTYKKSNEDKNPETGGKTILPVIGYFPIGKGCLIFSTLNIKGFAGNPVFDRFIQNLIDLKWHS